MSFFAATKADLRVDKLSLYSAGNEQQAVFQQCFATMKDFEFDIKELCRVVWQNGNNNKKAKRLSHFT